MALQRTRADLHGLLHHGDVLRRSVVVLRIFGGRRLEKRSPLVRSRDEFEPKGGWVTGGLVVQFVSHQE